MHFIELLSDDIADKLWKSPGGEKIVSVKLGRISEKNTPKNTIFLFFKYWNLIFLTLYTNPQSLKLQSKPIEVDIL